MSKRRIWPLVRFLAGHSAGVALLNLAVGLALFVSDRASAFSGVHLVVALYTAPVAMLLAAPLHALAYFFSRRPMLWSAGFSVLCVGAFNLFLHV